jgi:hypothetical protein
VCTTGRLCLAVGNGERATASAYVGVLDVTLQGPVIEYGKWHHFVAAYDGTMFRFYVDGRLVGECDLRVEATRRSAAVRDARRREMAELDAQEQRARDGCKQRTEEECAGFFKTPAGNAEVKTMAVKLIEHSEFTIKMDANAEEKGLKKLTKKEAMAKAKGEHKTAKYMANMRDLAEEYKAKRDGIRLAIATEVDAARERAAKPLRVGGDAPSKKDADGRAFWNGRIR